MTSILTSILYYLGFEMKKQSTFFKVGADKTVPFNLLYTRLLKEEGSLLRLKDIEHLSDIEKEILAPTEAKLGRAENIKYVTCRGEDVDINSWLSSLIKNRELVIFDDISRMRFPEKWDDLRKARYIADACSLEDCTALIGIHGFGEKFSKLALDMFENVIALGYPEEGKVTVKFDKILFTCDAIKDSQRGYFEIK